MVFGADLQEPPSLLAEFLDHWEAGNQVVWGVRRTRTGRSWANELASKTFSVLFTRYAKLANYPPEGPSGVLVDRCVIDELAQLPERNRNVLALIAWLGFTQTRVDYDQVARKHGQSRWTKRKMVKLAVDSLIQFSSMPLRACTFTGIGRGHGRPRVRGVPDRPEPAGRPDPQRMADGSGRQLSCSAACSSPSSASWASTSGGRSTRPAAAPCTSSGTSAPPARTAMADDSSTPHGRVVGPISTRGWRRRPSSQHVNIAREGSITG